MIPVYAYLVKSGEWTIETVKNAKKNSPRSIQTANCRILSRSS
ncbi:CD1375 family protein [Brevibacillus halotolerans]|nr:MULTISPECIES: CD1375 family protein [Brevibacillus]MCR8963459.1 CD1375 family protein [Brevibacillus laterosporus]MCZ0835615.1 CD1375 family protein [Brevibacillus halotolerans]